MGAAAGTPGLKGAIGMAAAIRLQRVTKAFASDQGRVTALQDVTCEIEEKSFVALVGPSGCGKSTILNLVSGLMEPSAGRVEYKGKAVSGINTDAGYVTQESKLFPWLTLEQNVAFPLEVRGVPAADRRRLVDEHLAMVGLTGFERAYPYQLSGGMQKRASIIRTIIYDPDVILMDEPFGPLDAQTRMILQNDLLKIWSQKRKTIVFVTHDLAEALTLSDRVVVFSARPARIRDIIDVEIARPRNVFQPHQMDGFATLYERLWKTFREELHIA